MKERAREMMDGKEWKGRGGRGRRREKERGGNVESYHLLLSNLIID